MSGVVSRVSRYEKSEFSTSFTLNPSLYDIRIMRSACNVFSRASIIHKSETIIVTALMFRRQIGGVR